MPLFVVVFHPQWCSLALLVAVVPHLEVLPKFLNLSNRSWLVGRLQRNLTFVKHEAKCCYDPLTYMS